MATAAGLSGAFSGHSGRVGMARDLVAGGASVAAVQVAGRWESARMPALYARGELVPPVVPWRSTTVECAPPTRPIFPPPPQKEGVGHGPEVSPYGL